jgi:hypothetical protein
MMYAKNIRLLNKAVADEMTVIKNYNVWSMKMLSIPTQSVRNYLKTWW